MGLGSRDDAAATPGNGRARGRPCLSDRFGGNEAEERRRSDKGRRPIAGSPPSAAAANLTVAVVAVVAPPRRQMRILPLAKSAVRRAFGPWARDDAVARLQQFWAKCSTNDGYSLCPSPMGVDIPLEIHKLVVVVVFLLLAGFSNWIALAWIHDFVGRTALPDVIFDLIPEQTWALKVGDLMVTFCSSMMIILMVMHKHRAIVIRRILFIIAVLYTMRTLSLLFTQLPSGYVDNSNICAPQLNATDRTFAVYWNRFLRQTIHVGFQDIEDKMLCGDLLFSGHTLIMVISSLTIEHYIPDALRLLRFLPKIFMVIGMVCMVISRTHYTVDVMFAYWISVFVFTIYHAFCEIDTYRERKNSVLSRMWIIRMISWLEANVIPGRLENSFDSPIPRSVFSSLCRSDERRSGQPQNISNSSSTVSETA